jgi:hypothetical protein
MANAPQVFQITPAQYSSFVSKAQAAGITVAGRTGIASKAGFTVEWTYDGAVLSVTVVSAPPFMTGWAQDQIAKLVAENLVSG